MIVPPCTEPTPLAAAARAKNLASQLVGTSKPDTSVGGYEVRAHASTLARTATGAACRQQNPSDRTPTINQAPGTLTTTPALQHRQGGSHRPRPQAPCSSCPDAQRRGRSQGPRTGPRVPLPASRTRSRQALRLQKSAHWSPASGLTHRGPATLRHQLPLPCPPQARPPAGQHPATRTTRARRWKPVPQWPHQQTPWGHSSPLRRARARRRQAARPKPRVQGCQALRRAEGRCGKHRTCCRPAPALSCQLPAPPWPSTGLQGLADRSPKARTHLLRGLPPEPCPAPDQARAAEHRSS